MEFTGEFKFRRAKSGCLKSLILVVWLFRERKHVQGWLAGRRAAAYPHYHETTRHRIRQDAAIPPAGRKFQNPNASINIFESCRSLISKIYCFLLSRKNSLFLSAFFYLSRISAFRRHLELASMSRLNESHAYQDQQAYL